MGETVDNKAYLGDGVYVEGDGYNIILYTDHGYGSPDNTIYLEPRVYDALQQWVKVHGCG